MMEAAEYAWRLGRSVWKSDGRGAAVRPRNLIRVAVLLVLLGAAGVVGSAVGLEHRGGSEALDAMLRRAEAAGYAMRQVETVYQARIAPIERVLMHYRNDQRIARRIATALVREAGRVDLDPRVLLAVLLVENPWLDPEATSPVGARGLMQVMPWHDGRWPSCPPRAIGIEANICYGAQIFAANLEDTGGDVERALLRYNGCVKGTNTPNCHFYPQLLYARAGRAAILSHIRARSD